MRYRFLLVLFLVVVTGCQGRNDAPPTGAVDPTPPLERILPARAIPALDAPQAFPANQTPAHIGPLTTVLGVTVNGEARAYPIGMLSRREIVNDTLGGEAIAITFCPLCNSAVVLSRTVNGQTLTFDHSGELLDATLVMVDRETESLWPQSRLAAITGPLAGQKLELLAANQMTWEAWLVEHPDTTVVTDGAQPVRSGSLLPTVGGTSESVAGYVLGIATPQGVRAYPLDDLAAAGVVNDASPDGMPLLFVALGEPGEVAVWQREVNGQTLTFQRDGAALMDSETGSTWDTATGQATAGTLQGTQLIRADAMLTHWLGWADLYPQSEVWKP